MSYRFVDEDGQHVHTLDGQPLIGCSTVIKEVMPPFLAKWGAQCAVDFLKENPGEWDKAVTAWSKVRDKAAGKGTDMHAALEGYVQHCIDVGSVSVPPHDEVPAVHAFAAWAHDNVEQFILCEAHTYSRETWTGGIVDCVARLKTGEVAVIDFKSSKEAYFNQYLQCAGYALMLNERGAYKKDGTPMEPVSPITALLVIPFGAKVIKTYKVTNVEEFTKAFTNVVNVYTLQQAFKRK